jgi:hypothetical protein
MVIITSVTKAHALRTLAIAETETILMRMILSICSSSETGIHEFLSTLSGHDYGYGCTRPAEHTKPMYGMAWQRQQPKHAPKQLCSSTFHSGGSSAMV